MTHVRDTGGSLKVILWTLNNDGMIRGADRTGYAVEEIAAFGNVAAVRDDIGKLRVGLWQVTAGSQPGGGIINPVGDGQAGKASNIAISRLTGVSNPPPGLEIDRIATAVRDGDGNLSVVVWHLVGSSVH